MGIVAAVCMVVLLLVAAVATPLLAKQFLASDNGEQIDKEEYKRKQTAYEEKIKQFDSLYHEFSLKYDEFVYATHIVEASKPLYANDKSVQEMNQYVGFYRKEAEKLKESAEYLKDTYKTPTEVKNSEYEFLNYTLNTQHLVELKKKYVELSDMTTMVNNSVVNVDIFNGYFFLEETNKAVVNAAESVIGEIRYVWGGKPVRSGWNDAWGKGLDCSGFVQWVYWTATGEHIKNISSTHSISFSQEKIGYEELKPGDLGMMYDGGTYYLDANGNKFSSPKEAEESNRNLGMEEVEVVIHTNHVGIYAGKDMYGKDIWIHCQGQPVNTVVKGAFPGFKVFYRVITETGE